MDNTTAIKLIRKHRRESNFVFIHIFDPHLDYDPLPSYRTKFTSGREQPSPPLSMQKCQAMKTNDHRDPPVLADINYIFRSGYSTLLPSQLISILLLVFLVFL